MAGVICRALARKAISQNETLKLSVIPKRFTSLDAWVYRSVPKDPPYLNVILGKSLNAFAWWWMLTHCWYQWGHLVGEFDYPDRKKWTNEELGVVPPED